MSDKRPIGDQLYEIAETLKGYAEVGEPFTWTQENSDDLAFLSEWVERIAEMFGGRNEGER